MESYDVNCHMFAEQTHDTLTIQDNGVNLKQTGTHIGNTERVRNSKDEATYRDSNEPYDYVKGMPQLVRRHITHMPPVHETETDDAGGEELCRNKTKGVIEADQAISQRKRDDEICECTVGVGETEKGGDYDVVTVHVNHLQGRGATSKTKALPFCSTTKEK